MPAVRDRLVRQVDLLPLRLLRHLLLLQTSWPLTSIQTANHIGCPFFALLEKVLVRSQGLPREQVIRGCYLIVSVGLDAFH